MRAASIRWPATLRTSHGVAGPEVLSYLGDAPQPITTASIPVIEGTITWDDSATLRSRVHLSVPAYDSRTGRSWYPGLNAGAPLAAYGQRLRVSAGIVHSDGTVERLMLGRFLISSWEYSEASGRIEVEAVDLAQLLVDDRINRAESVPAAGTYYGEVFRRVNNLLPGAALPPTLVDRAIGPNKVWDALTSRAEQLDTLCAAWPARWFVSDTGYVSVAPPYGTDYSNPVVSVIAGPTGTVTDRAQSGERGRIYNAVVVNGQAGAGGAAGPFASVAITTGPIRVGGPYGRRPRFYSSEMITTQAQADATAAALLQRASVDGRSESVLAVPDARIELGDVAKITSPGGGTFNGRVQAITLPLGTTGPMALTVVTQPT